MSHFILKTLAALFILLLSSIQIDLVMTDEVMSPTATVHIYSGRPNPRWTLSLDEWQQLNQLIRTLPKLTEDNHGPYRFQGGLGYTGFNAHFVIVSSYPDIYYVSNKQEAVLSNPGGHDIFKDTNKVIEQWFIDSAKKHGIPLPI